MLEKKHRIHFVGIGGIGMSGIAEVLLNLGYTVTGSDLRESETIERLQALGAEVFLGHREANLSGNPSVVVISTAVKFTNPEVLEARRRSIPVIPRAEMLAELMRMKYGIAVAGSHGKTTTTSMIAAVLSAAGLDPTMVIGGRVRALGSNARLGQGEMLVAEADESDGTFLLLSPTIAVVTNIDREHIDFHQTMERLMESFLNFINKVPFYGAAVLCLDHPNVRALIPKMKKRFVTYGFSPEADWSARDLSMSPMAVEFPVARHGSVVGRLKLNIPGRHSASNALAAVAVAQELEIPFARIAEGLESFTGIHRRFEVKGEAKGILVIDDYGHHPVEIRATIAAIRDSWKRPLTVLFQPHRYSRTRDLFDDFVTAFEGADRLVLTEVYAAGEEPMAGASGEALYQAVKQHGHLDVEYVADKERIAQRLLPKLQSGDIVLTLGAGDIYKVGEQIVKALGK
ncbi:MAG: UDP-N-acetylmuramate--L-alanine ligase [Deltaproteobacteria bacterium RIFCSPLOWO2_12_FULL_60_19]|nr:MAG: UDP-N-acetylmuramate--L-alanine ligase [Deltaproteobacteria bacterium RIFCSPLOWO2_12_FULL_60_19]